MKHLNGNKIELSLDESIETSLPLIVETQTIDFLGLIDEIEGNLAAIHQAQLSTESPQERRYLGEPIDDQKRKLRFRQELAADLLGLPLSVELFPYKFGKDGKVISD